MGSRWQCDKKTKQMQYQIAYILIIVVSLYKLPSLFYLLCYYAVPWSVHAVCLAWLLSPVSLSAEPWAQALPAKDF